VNLDTLFDVQGFSFDKFRSDTKFIKHQVDFIKIVWKLFLYLSCCTIIYMEKCDDSLDPEQISRAHPILAYIEKLNNEIRYVDSDGKHFDYWAIYVYCFELVTQYIDHAVLKGSNEVDKFIPSLIAATHTKKIISACFPSDIHTALEDVASHCKRKFIISFDGFDTKYEQFRADSLLLQNKELMKFRLQFEIDWLRGLVHLAEEIRSNRSRESLNKIVEFYLTIPKDRFLEIKDIERDAYI
jgi:hypothetical protein